MKKIGLVVAMDKELDLILSAMSGGVVCESYDSFTFNVGDYNEDVELVVAKSGIGKVNSALCIASMIKNYAVDYIITSGVCGSLAKFGINQGDVVLASSVKYHDAWCGKPNKLGQIQGLPESYEPMFGDKASITALGSVLASNLKDTNVYVDKLVSGDWFVDTMQKAKGIATKCFKYKDHNVHACAVDMETASIAQTCYIYKTPFISLRIISDTPLAEEDGKTYDDFWVNAPNTLSEAVQLIIKNVDYE